MSWFSARPGCEVVTTPQPARRRRLPASFTDWMTTPDGVSRCRLAPMRDLVFTTPTPPPRAKLSYVR